MSNRLAQYKRLVIKIGSAILVNGETGQLREPWLTALATEIAELRQSGMDVIIVSSGAIALGRNRLGLTKSRLTLAEKQACASAGQSRLTQAYEKAFDAVNIIAAQALLTLNDTEDRRRWLNARSTLNALLKIGAVPIINENDTVATDEIRYGDNDRLAARTAQMLGADGLVLLSDIDGLYDADPRQTPEATHIPRVENLTDDVIAMAGSANQVAAVGTGGMITKLMAAKIATQAGCDLIIANGEAIGALSQLNQGAKHTIFMAEENPKKARTQWILGTLKPRGKLTIDAGAVSALQSGKSLLAAGATALNGSFEKGDSVSIMTAEGLEIARGLIAYDAAEVTQILGLRSSEISDILGYDNGTALIHRDNMAIL